MNETPKTWGLKVNDEIVRVYFDFQQARDDLSIMSHHDEITKRFGFRVVPVLITEVKEDE